jgi:hypothetical protein
MPGLDADGITAAQEVLPERLRAVFDVTPFRRLHRRIR